jgi:glycosyltransferase involved in cell wall biosynthesis
MRLLVAVDHWFPDHRGGAARVAAETAARFAAAGAAVDVLAPRGGPRLERRGALTVHRVLPRTVAPQTLTDPLAVRLAARAFDADVLLAHTTTTAVGLARLDRPLVLVFHASAPREARFDRERGLRPHGRPLEAALRRLERLALARADRILVLSAFSRTLLERDHPEVLPRVRLVRGGVDVGRFRPGDADAARRRLGLAAGPPLLLAVRRLEPRMGLGLLLESVALLRRPVRLAIVGRGSLADTLSRLRSTLGLNETVTLVGGVDDDELCDWYRAADLCVVPTIAYEGFGLATAEALASGTPVVGTQVGATPELLAPLDERLLADRVDPSSLAATLERALDRRLPAERCRAYAEAELSWEAAFPSWTSALANLDVRGVPRRASAVRSS